MIYEDLTGKVQDYSQASQEFYTTQWQNQRVTALIGAAIGKKAYIWLYMPPNLDGDFNAADTLKSVLSNIGGNIERADKYLATASGDKVEGMPTALIKLEIQLIARDYSI